MDLPVITDEQEWCCSRGCGVCTPKPIEREFSRTTEADGTVLERKTEQVWVSACCLAALMLWDNGMQDFVDVPELALID